MPAGPGSPLAWAIAGVLREALDNPEVGLDDDFFLLGGHSLLVTQVVARIQASQGIHLPLLAVFEHPTASRLAAAIEAGTFSAHEGEPPPVRPIPRLSDRFPLSFSQRRLWFLDRLEPNGIVYNVPQGVRLQGTLNLAALWQALREVIRRHEPLRTTYGMDDGEPVQLVGLPWTLALPIIALDGLDPGRTVGEAARLAKEEATQPFDLEHGPVLRGRLIRLAQDDHLLVLVIHHIAADGWSMGVLLREVAKLYRDLSRGMEPDLPELTVQYVDYAAWERYWLQGKVLADQLAYWSSRLAGHPPLLRLPTDRPRPAVQAFRGGLQAFALAPELSARLEALGFSQRATIFMVLLAGLQALLHRYTGEEDVLIGSPVAGRRRAELEPLIGCFTNTLVLRFDLGGDPTFTGLLNRTRAATLDAYAHQDLPFERLVQELQPERTLSFHPFFQVAIVLHNAPMGALELPGLRLALWPIDPGVSRFDLLLDVTETPEGLRGWLEHDSDLFDPSTAARMLGHLAVLLAGAAAEPEQRLSELPLLTRAERVQLVAEWSGAAVSPPSPASPLHLFFGQVERQPEAIALIAGEERWSYRRLGSRVKRLARRLSGLGVGPEVVVGILAGRTPEMVTALLAVLEAGGAYLPLDPSYPLERLAFLLADSGAPVVLTEDRLRTVLPSFGGQVLILEEESTEGESVPGEAVSPWDPEGLAYVIYTSGSTGAPKGVAVRRGSTAARIAWAAELYGPERLAGTLASTSINFDLSVFELFAPLAIGGTVILADTALDLPGLPAAGSTTLVNTVPSVMTELIRSGRLPSSVKTVNLAGEALPQELATDLHKLPGVEAVWNLYGPSEDTTYSTAALVKPMADRPPAIGRPLPGTLVYVLDRAGELVPAGVPGEPWLGGVGTARGYLGRPDLTADRFRPDPFGGEPGGRLYRTGDLVRWLAGGELAFLGRLDHQVKVRGFRVELGEIEAALASCPGVEETVVVARDEGAGGVRLVAYVAGAGAREVELREALRRSLPEYMVPTDFVQLCALPRTQNGKVDRKALPAPERAGSGGRAETERPWTQLEDLLAGIWEEVLSTDRIGLHDGFFDLGGHSLLATQAVSRVREVLGVELPVRAVFEAPTVAALAARLERERGAGLGTMAPPLLPVPRQGDLPLSFAQERLWFLHQLDPGSSAYNLSAAFRLRGTLDTEALAGGFAGLVRRHESLRTAFHSGEQGPVQTPLAPEPLPVPVVDLSEVPQERRDTAARQLAQQEARQAFDLSAGRLIRVTCLRLGEAEHMLVVVLHHIAADGWSLGIIVQELSDLYTSLTQGVEPSLPELPIQYADYACWQREYLQGETVAEQLGYWRRQLDGVPVVELPADRPRPVAVSSRGGAVPLAAPEPLVGELARLCRREGVSLFMILVAAFQALISRATGERDVPVGAPIANRARRELERIVGFFVNSLVLRVDLQGDPSWRELLGRVREVCLEAFAHQDLPFEQLVEALQPERNLSRTPLFQHMLALQNALVAAPDLPGLSLSPVAFQHGTAKFDLTLDLWESGGLQGNLVYSADLFDATTAGRMAEQLLTLLAGAVADPGVRLSELPLLAAAQRHQVILEWSGTEGVPATGSLVERFAAQVRRAPEALALLFETVHWTFAELDAEANRLAWFLRAQGVGPEVVVALCLERGPALAAAVLAVLKAGGAFCPLSPSDPPQRIAALLADVHPRVLLTHSALATGLMLPPGVRPVCLDLDEPAIARCSPRPLPQGGTGNELAYVLYTSGSTGHPKGVQIAHGSLLDYLEWIGETLATSGVRRIPWITRLTFDACLKQLFSPLLRGEAVWILPEEIGGDPAALLRTLDGREEVGLNCVPSLWQAIVETAERGEAPIPAGLVCLLLGGERLSEDLVARSRRLLPGVRILNLYGPTEATANASWAVVEEGDRVTVGRPLPRHTLRLLDSHLLPVPTGVRGELFVGGFGLARGYLGRPELTAAAFLPDPWGAPGARLYRTGDLGRFLPDGRLQLQGRADLQVKVRGQRIEIEEIEAVLALHPAVRECCVLLQEDPEVGTALVAAVVLTELEAATERELGEHLAQSLPAAMVPAVALLPEPLPRLSSGKIDRRGLARRGIEVQRGGREVVAPRTAAEEIVAGIFAEVLGTQGVGAQDDFFDLGGHSLLATRVAARLRQVFRTDLPLRALFETPTVERLARLLEGSRGGGAPASIEPLAMRERLPLSFAQHRLWFLDQMIPGSSMYNIPHRAELAGSLSRAALERSLAEIRRRHESLRTTFPAVGGNPYQAVSPAWDLMLPLVDLTGLEDADAEVERLTLEEAGQGFDLLTGPLARFRLLQVGNDRHHLLCTLHHIVADGWSMDVLLRELAALYKAFAEGRPSPLPELPVQYADFAVWQRERWSRGELLGQLDFWRERLAGLPSLELPVDGRRSDTERPLAAAWPFALPPELGSALASLSRRQGATRFMSFLAGLQALLGRLSGQEDFAVGSPVAGREHHDLEGLIGFFVNTLVLRCDLADDPPLAAHLERVRNAALDAYQNQELPFEKLVEELQPERRLGQTPLFQVLFVFQEEAPQVPRTPGLQWALHQPPATVAKFDLSLVLHEHEGLVTGLIEYRTDLFSQAAIRRLAGHFQTLLAGIAAQPGLRLSELPLLTAAERWQLMEWSASPGAGFAERTLSERIEEQARRRPDAVAVVFQGRSLTYRELDRRAEGVAARLRELGVGPGTLVGLCVERSPELVVGLYGALKTGAAYVPIDPGYPRERVAYLLEDSGAAVLLSRRHLTEVLPDAPERLVFLDGLLDEGGEAEPGPRAKGPGIDGLLYTIYTSGSTGRPKAAGVYQRAFLNLLRWYVEDLGGTAEDRYLLLSSFSFDLTQKNLFAPLVTGGRLVLGEEPYDPALLVATIAREGVTRLTCTPSAFYPLLAERDFDRLSSLRMVALGGEPVAAERLSAWRRSGLCRAEIVNSYGPTECTDIVAYHRLPESAEPAAVPAGRPVPGARLWVADADMSLLPVGVAGQLWIGGLSVGAGYLREVASTATKFRPDPFSGEPGARVYATGDRARWLAGGEIEYLGRIDQQVKIRGFRIEPGEVESALRSHPGVAEAVVAAPAGPGGDLRLVAYVTAAGEEPPASGELRTFLVSRLPVHMVPAWFVVLRELPLTPSGKIDRGALHLPRELDETGRAGFVAPRSLLEQTIADIWARVLGLERVGAFDSFFELGGHSLNATQVVSQLREELGVEVPLRTLFRTPTVADLAVSILEQMADEAGEDVLAMPFGDLGEPAAQTAVQSPSGEPS
jgi:amino acid adenylation domain-containing protein